MNKLILLGIGVFIFGTINSLAYLFEIVLRHLQMWFGQTPVANFWISELSTLFLFALLSYIILKWFTKKGHFEGDLRKTFFIWIIGFVVVQIVQGLYGFFGTAFIIENKPGNFSLYFNTLKDRPVLKTYRSLFSILKYLIFAFFIFNAQNCLSKKARQQSKNQRITQ